MDNQSNVKPGMRRGEYIGFAAGLVWIIRQYGDEWWAWPSFGGARAIQAPSLAAMSERLTQADRRQP